MKSPPCAYLPASHNQPTPDRTTCLVQLGQQRHMKLLPEALNLPIAQASPACHTAAKTQRLGQVLPREPGSKDKQDAVEDGMVIEAWTATSRRSVPGWQEWL